MERRVSVNAGTIAAVTPDGLPRGWSQPWPPAQAGREGGDTAGRDADPAGQGPCLYLGPRGERCWRQGVARGFCATHDPDRANNLAAHPSRFWAAAGAIVALLWPYLEFVVRDIIRWARSR
jgi:hypothetical protein